ncbi:MAG: sulfotransferase [Gammaproteobacteria bacterium]|nr:sulfotransferase [Gammaproteobacteria bacterium]
MHIKMLKSYLDRLDNIKRPIAIVGTERSGTTLLYSILANDPTLYWYSRLDSLLPNSPILTTSLRKIAETVKPQVYTAIPGKISKTRGLIPPSECIPCWKKIFNWGTEDNYILQDDYFEEFNVPPSTKEKIYDDLKLRLLVSGKKRLLFKWPGLSLKIRFLYDVFPDIIILHIIRNPVDNLASLIKAKKKAYQSTGERFWGIKIPGWKDLIQEDFAVQAALQIIKVDELIEKDILQFNLVQRKQYFRIKYEDLLSAPEQTVEKVLHFSGLKSSVRIHQALAGVSKPTSTISREIMKSLPQSLQHKLEELSQKYGYI